MTGAASTNNQTHANKDNILSSNMPTVTPTIVILLLVLALN